MYKNMKIEINEQQPLDDVVKELEWLGYRDVNLGWESKTGIVFIDNESKLFCITVDHIDIDAVTLAELKEM